MRTLILLEIVRMVLHFIKCMTLITSIILSTYFIIIYRLTQVRSLIILMFILLLRCNNQLPTSFLRFMPVNTFTVIVINFVFTLFSFECTRCKNILCLDHIKLLVLNHRVQSELMVQRNNIHVCVGTVGDLLVAGVALFEGRVLAGVVAGRRVLLEFVVVVGFVEVGLGIIVVVEIVFGYFVVVFFLGIVWMCVRLNSGQ